MAPQIWYPNSNMFVYRNFLVIWHPYIGRWLYILLVYPFLVLKQNVKTTSGMLIPYLFAAMYFCFSPSLGRYLKKLLFHRSPIAELLTILMSELNPQNSIKKSISQTFAQEKRLEMVQLRNQPGFQSVHIKVCFIVTSVLDM
jgi:hypothetical protein